MAAEIHLFVLWPRARRIEERILEDMGKNVEILAKIKTSWPKGMAPDEGYLKFYGPGLPDAAGKAKRAGVGEFLIAIVRLAEPVYDWRMTQRGHEKVNLVMFDLKWRYREWTGGLHQVHGTASTDEARRDILLLTGQTLESWVDGSADPGKVVTLSPEAIAAAGTAPTARPPEDLAAAKAFFGRSGAEIAHLDCAGSEAGNGFRLQLQVWEEDEKATVKPLLWHTGAKGVFIAQEPAPGVTLAEFIRTGRATRATSDVAAASARRLVAALDAAGVVHRAIGESTLFVSPSGELTLTGFEFGVDRARYRFESRYFRKNIASRLVPLGGDGVCRPGAWNDRFAIARCLKLLPSTPALDSVIAGLEKEAREGIGELALSLSKLRFRLAILYLNSISSSPAARRARRFVAGAFGFGGKTK